jgi:ribokinase
MVTVFGSINVDLSLRLPHLPRPGETVLADGSTQTLGGKGANQAVAAARDGAMVHLVGAVGNDGLGAFARQEIAAAAVDVANVTSARSPSGLAMIWVDASGQNMIAVASGANLEARAAAIPTSLLGGDTVVVLQMEVPPGEVAQAIVRAKDSSSRVVLNLAPALPLASEALRAVDVLVVNEIEAEALCAMLGAQYSRRDAPETMLTALGAELSNDVVITLGAAGAIARHDGAVLRQTAPPIEALDTTGAGDCLVGVLASALERREPFALALRRAVTAASLACTRPGAAPSFPSAAEIEARIAR